MKFFIAFLLMLSFNSEFASAGLGSKVCSTKAKKCSGTLKYTIRRSVSKLKRNAKTHCSNYGMYLSDWSFEKSNRRGQRSKIINYECKRK